MTRSRFPRKGAPPRLALAVVLLCLAAVGGCEPGPTTTPNGSRLELPAEVAPVEFELATVVLLVEDAAHPLRAEIAETPRQRERGLMYRSAMPEDAGMLFIYEQEQEGGFWMYNTHLPLSIAYADSAGVIFQVRDMEPCPSPYGSLCPIYPASRAFKYALEVNQNAFARRGVGPGARIELRR